MLTQAVAGKELTKFMSWLQTFAWYEDEVEDLSEALKKITTS